jgi:hypothetical protein
MNKKDYLPPFTNVVLVKAQLVICTSTTSSIESFEDGDPVVLFN